MPETEPNPPAKGAFTSEFWLTVVGVVALVGLVLHGDLNGDWAAGAIGFACFGYSASRAVVKRAQVTGDADVRAAAVTGEAKVADFKADLALLAAQGVDPTDTVAMAAPPRKVAPKPRPSPAKRSG